MMFSEQDVHCQICAKKFQTKFSGYDGGRVCGAVCWSEYEWRKTLALLGKPYRVRDAKMTPERVKEVIQIRTKSIETKLFFKQGDSHYMNEITSHFVSIAKKDYNFSLLSDLEKAEVHYRFRCESTYSNRLCSSHSSECLAPEHLAIDAHERFERLGKYHIPMRSETISKEETLP